MSYQFYKFLHLFSVLLLIGFTFYSFAGPKALSKKWVLGITGVLSLIVLVSAFGLQARLSLGWPGWFIAKFVIWLIIAALSGIAYRRRGLEGAFLAIGAVLTAAATWLVFYKPF